MTLVGRKLSNRSHTHTTSFKMKSFFQCTITGGIIKIGCKINLISSTHFIYRGEQASEQNLHRRMHYIKITSRGHGT